MTATASACIKKPQPGTGRAPLATTPVAEGHRHARSSVRDWLRDSLIRERARGCQLIGSRPMRAAAATAIVLLLGGCALRARDHPCWPFLAHLYHDRVPKDVVRALARDRDARRTVRGARAPTGAYWRRRR